MFLNATASTGRFSCEVNSCVAVCWSFEWNQTSFANSYFIFHFSIGNKFDISRVVEQFDMRLKSGIWCDFHLIVGRINKIASGFTNLYEFFSFHVSVRVLFTSVLAVETMTRNIQQTPRKTIVAALVVIGAIASASAQLSYHLDANTNSYTLQTPNSQQTFTRYFGQPNGNGIAASHIQPAQSQQQVDIINVFPIRYRQFLLQHFEGEFTFRNLLYLCMVIWILNCFGAIYHFLQHGKCGKLLYWNWRKANAKWFKYLSKLTVAYSCVVQ